MYNPAPLIETHPHLHRAFMRHVKGLKKLMAELQQTYPTAYLRVYEGGLSIIPHENMDEHGHELVEEYIGCIDGGGELFM